MQRPKVPEMTDIAFGLKGKSIPEGYMFELWREVICHLPWMESDEHAGILPLRAASGGGHMLLAQRAKLVLRVAVEHVPRVWVLAGKELDIGGSILQVGEAGERPFKPYPTLHAHLVEGPDEEAAFLAEAGGALRDMGIACKLICGMRSEIRGAGQAISGFSLVLHDLKPEESLLVQHAGLGGSRRFGCGMFVPFKTISV